MLTLLLTLASVTTQHTISEVTFTRDNLVTYTESGTLYLCRRASYEYGTDFVVRVAAPQCTPDRVFENGFD